ncbi:MAG TPA: hypothetical protein VHZ54_14590 [Solirubrobacterales bacterium]|nr:hypothetical protein [Solirubrobacterales bacterium]
MTILCLSAAAVVLGAGAASAKPHKAFAPKVGGYGGDSIAGGKSHSVVAKVTRRGPKYSAEVEIAFPAVCTNSETDFTGPSELIYKVIAPIKGQAISFKGDSRDTLGILYPLASTITLNGKFTSGSKFTATAAVKAPAEGTESKVTCSAPAVRLPFQFELPL